MLSRGYKGELMTIHPHHYQNSDIWIGVVCLLILVAMQVAGRL